MAFPVDAGSAIRENGRASQSLPKRRSRRSLPEVPVTGDFRLLLLARFEGSRRGRACWVVRPTRVRKAGTNRLTRTAIDWSVMRTFVRVPGEPAGTWLWAALADGLRALHARDAGGQFRKRWPCTTRHAPPRREPKAREARWENRRQAPAYSRALRRPSPPARIRPMSAHL